jgi:hypothetical protein
MMMATRRGQREACRLSVAFVKLTVIARSTPVYPDDGQADAVVDEVTASKEGKMYQDFGPNHFNAATRRSRNTSSSNA